MMPAQDKHARTPMDQLWAERETRPAGPELVIDVDGIEGPLDLLLHLARN